MLGQGEWMKVRARWVGNLLCVVWVRARWVSNLLCVCCVSEGKVMCCVSEGKVSELLCVDLLCVVSVELFITSMCTVYTYRGRPTVWLTTILILRQRKLYLFSTSILYLKITNLVSQLSIYQYTVQPGSYLCIVKPVTKMSICSTILYYPYTYSVPEFGCFIIIFVYCVFCVFY